MRITYWLFLICVLGMCPAEVSVGFEAETKKFTITESISSDMPVISGKSWGLVTDTEVTPGYEPEFSTIGGLKMDEIIQAAKEIKSVLSTMLNKVNNVSEKLSSYETFKELMKKRQENISEMYRCLNTDSNEGVNISQDINKLKEMCNCISLLYFDKAYKDADKEESQKGLEKIKEDVKKYCNKPMEKSYSPYDPSIINLFDDPELLNSYNNLKDNQGFTEKGFEGQLETIARMSLIKKLKKQYINSKYLIDSNLIEKLKKEIEESYSAIQDNDDEQKIKTQLLGTVENFRKNKAVSYNFDNLDTDLKTNDNFEAFCKYDDETTFDVGQHDESTDKNFVCPKSKVNIVFQLTYKTKLASIPNLLRFYSSYSVVLEEPEAVEKLNRQYVPIDLIQMGNCLMNGNSCLNVININQNQRFVKLWETKRQTIQNIIDKHYEINSNRDAEGLFYLVLSYALRIFNRSDVPFDEYAQKYYLSYGPKQNLPIMSRGAFSELFDNLSEDGRKFFIELVNNLCDFDFQTDKISEEEIIDNLSCSNLKLVKYLNKSGGFNDLDYFIETKSMNFIDWVESIIKIDKRHPAQPEINVTNRERVMKRTDLISPPPGFTFRPNETKNTWEKKLKKHKIYGMGAYTGFQDGHVLIELRSYEYLPITANNMEAFIEGHAALLFDLLSEEEQITDFGAYHERANKMQAEHMEQTEINGEPTTDFIQQKRLLI